MTDSLGNARFDNWKADSRKEGFASRLMAEWLQWRCGCSRRTALLLMDAHLDGPTLDDLIDVVFASLGECRTPEPNTPRRNRWRKSSRFASVETARRISLPAGSAPGLRASSKPAVSTGAFAWPFKTLDSRTVK
ncbi:MAG: hypothetical protein V4636_24285 [Pseudomonadota bacterium]